LKDNLLTRKEASLLCHNSRVLICKRFNPNCIKGFTNISKGCTSYPLLFLFFINDVADNMTGFGRKFADDTFIGHMAHNEENLNALFS
jgi:hypothetical protein